MKIKIDFVTNSSSTAYLITNFSEKELDLVQFVKENPQLIEMFLKLYSSHDGEEGFTQEGLLHSAEKNNIKFKPGQIKYCIFGDEDGTIIGHVFDYILRYGGSSDNFRWTLYEYLR